MAAVPKNKIARPAGDEALAAVASIVVFEKERPSLELIS
jgi:hypothetical protein